MNRIQIDEIEPLAFEGLMDLEKYLANSELSSTHKDLIKIRASLINKCAFCIDMHTKEALQNKEDLRRIFLLSAWKETTFFNEEERVVLQITEEITLINTNGLSEETYLKAIKLFSKNYLSQIIMAIITINAWNRIAISTKKLLPKS